MAQPFGLLQPVRGQEDRHAPLAQRRDQVVDLARRHGIKARGRLVEKQHRRVVEQRPGQRDPLTQPLGQRPAQVTGTVFEVDRPQRPADAPANVVELVEPGEALQVLQHRQTQVQTRGLGHDRDPRADRRTIPRAQRDPGDDRRPRTRRDQRPQRPHGRRLARTVRTQEAEHLAVADLERNLIKSDAIAEPLGQVLDHHSGLTRRAVEARGNIDRFSAASPAAAVCGVTGVSQRCREAPALHGGRAPRHVPVGWVPGAGQRRVAAHRPQPLIAGVRRPICGAHDRQ